MRSPHVCALVTAAHLSSQCTASCGSSSSAPSPAPPSPRADAAPSDAEAARPAAAPFPLAEARARFRSKLVRSAHQPRRPPPEPPPSLFRRVKYPAPLGELWAYVSPAPADGKKRPAVVWAHGGLDWSINEGYFRPGPPQDDQSAAAFREAGLVLMIPSFRGGNDNPGQYEEMLGEVDDFIAAADYAAKLPYVDGDRIYLAGHSTGGTIALLAAASFDRFRAAIAFGPIDNALSYGEEYAPFDPGAPEAAEEWRLRSPVAWAAGIRRTTLIIEGESGGNADSVGTIVEAAKKGGAPVTGHVLRGHSHFTTLFPVTRLLAQKMLADTGPTPDIDPFRQ